MTLVNVYDHTRLRFANNANASTDAYRVNLYTTFPFIPAATTKTAAEVGSVQLPTANGYTQNTMALTNVVTVQLGVNGASFTCSNIIWIASGGPIAAAHAMIFNFTDSNSPPLMHIDFEGTVTAAAGQPFAIGIDPNGLFSFTAT